jgi:hypothetical protein
VDGLELDNLELANAGRKLEERDFADRLPELRTPDG